MGLNDGAKIHFHMRWGSDKRLDWEPFRTRYEAEVRAKELQLAGESFSIAELDDLCTRCAPFRRKMK